MATAHRSARAEFDLIEIWGHIANDDPLAADRQLDLIGEACQMLAGHQHAGKSRDDLAPGLRFFPVGNYLFSTPRATMGSPSYECCMAPAIIGMVSTEIGAFRVDATSATRQHQCEPSPHCL